MRRNVLFILMAAFVLSSVPITADAAAPGIISYQGRVTDAQGDAVADGTYTLDFTIYDDSAAGIAYWSETQNNVAVSDGLFSVLLGTVVPLDDSVFNGPDRYLQVSVNGTPVLPRTRVASVAYAQRIETVDGATGGQIIDSLVLLNPEYLEQNPGKAAASLSRIVIAFGDGGTIDMYDPVDSKDAFSAVTKRVQIRPEGFIMFGETELDTNLFVGPNGDIVGLGQITMGENSSAGVETSVLGFQNTANGDSSAIGGGSANVTNGTSSVISGGHANTADGEGSSIGGGGNNLALGDYSVIGGGRDNTALGNYGTVPGGHFNSADAENSYAAGRRAKALHEGSFVWADRTDEDFTSTAPDQFIIRASGGVGIGTDNPQGALEVVSNDGDSAVILPQGSISADEIMEEPGLASTQEGAEVVLVQGQLMQTLTAVTITTPAAGYIHLTGGATLRTSGTSGKNQAFMQIDEFEDSSEESPYYVVIGSGDHDSPNTNHYFPAAVQRIFQKEAGTYTFYLEARPHPLNDPDGLTSMVNPVLTATYFPTAYGTVTATSGTPASTMD